MAKESIQNAEEWMMDIDNLIRVVVMLGLKEAVISKATWMYLAFKVAGEHRDKFFIDGDRLEFMGCNFIAEGVK